MKDNKIAFFNLLKFIGVICISCLLHYTDHLIKFIDGVNSFKYSPLLKIGFENGYVFVEMYFLISGILFALVYINRIEKGEKLSNFLRGRFIRIYPLVIISTIVIYILNYIYYREFATFFSCGGLGLSNLFLDLLSLRTIFDATTPINGPLWYIAALMICYILGYYIARRYKKNSFLYIIPIVIGLFVLNNNINFIIFNPLMARGFISFFTGVVLYKFVFENIEKISRKLVLLSKLLCLIVIVLFVLCLYNSNYNLYFDSYFNTLIAFNFFFFVPLFYILYDTNIINKICSSRIVMFLGNISYSTYVWNFPILIVVAYVIKSNILKMDTTSVWFFILLIFIHIIVGTLSYYFIEKKIKKFFDSKTKKSKK